MFEKNRELAHRIEKIIQLIAAYDEIF